MENNLRWLTMLRICKWFMLYMPVLILFYQSNGLSLEAALGVQAVYSLMIAIWEIPSGYISDRWGRRNSLLVGMALVMLQFILLSFSYTFEGFALGVALGGIGVSFVSGTDSALLYETLKAQGQEAHYTKEEGRQYAIGNVAESVAAILGGLLAWGFGLRVPILLQAIFSAVGLWAAFQLVEPPRQQRSSAHPLRDMLHIFHFLFRENRTLLLWLCLSAVVGSASHLLAWITQPYLKIWGWEEWAIGLAWSVLNLAVAAVSWHGYRFYQGRDKWGMAMFLLCGLAGGYFVLALSWWAGGAVAFVVLAILFALRGIAAPFFKEVINAQTPSDNRATVLSVREFLVRILYVLVAPWLGYIADAYSLEMAFLLEGLLLLGLGGLFGWGLKRAIGKGQ